ncbi:uncharacterized protein [Macrobrachium rosenbergii]|uniref:uncharacterized protein n=1 Tax=Macrobrachium rosenbergii TaxID=79674 RepID=UPI0034D57020
MSRHNRLSKRHSSSSRMGPMALILAALVATLLIPLVENAKEVLYVVGEAGTRGSQVLLAIPGAPSVRVCAATCSAATGCLGFNWIPGATQNCELLSSLRVVAAFTPCTLYVPEGLVRSAIKLEYSCPTCMPASPYATDFWEHTCPTNGVVVGIASVTSFPDLDYMLCIQQQGLLIDTSNGYTCADDSRGCNTISAANIPFNCMWSNSQYYYPSGSKRYVCRKITSTHKIDLTRCKNATETFGYTKGISTPVNMLRCPPHMVAQRLYASTTIPAYVICCLLY